MKTPWCYTCPMEHDHGYKLLFSHAEMVADLLRGFVREEWVYELDFSTLEKINGSYISDDLRERQDDIIWRLRRGKGETGEWLYVYLLLEFQSTVDWFMAVRIMTYVGLLYQDLIRSESIRTGERLPPVLPVVLYNGDTRWQAPVNMEGLIFPAPGGLDRYRPQLNYLLLDEGSYSDHELATLRNLTAALFRLENSRTPQDVEQVLQALIAWLQSPEQSGLRRSFTVWLKRVFLPGRMPGTSFSEIHDLQEVQSMLSERVKEWTKDWRQQGIEEGKQIGIEEGKQIGIQEGRLEGRQEGRQEGRLEGRQEGRLEGESEFLLYLLEQRFGPVSDAVRARIGSADTQTLLVWGKRILTAQTIEAVFGD
ncbi:MULTISPECIES: Rpn family recombination-promoting nuclease/putative transposase [Nitrosomonas]|uniref:Putative transposase n=1 Tax=Nitrosomonas europaea (strain ATCC 19718 / CIP 103999 / KCTC 2705 / NBRC 14298) TaxID=228410 RepID=Q82V09_NITEU|nr:MULTISPECIES: Rpn family recombination-promoting nuclease/putative transposase [Nitrosomonas]CAD85213.1 putative transposase [Nitrosomonas europaea ATCC 19718]HNR10661.1 Rpn family recombination-promoting nuclease/putative transposase [Nitrosomonas europaea]